MNVDWDAAAQDAARSPRGILSEWLGREDEIKMIAIAVVLKNGDISSSWSWRGEMSSLYVLGMLDTVKQDIVDVQKAEHRSEDE